MRIARLIVIGAVLVAGSGSADAGWFGSKQPKAMSPLYKAPEWKASHRSHPLRDYRYNRPGWGGLWNQVYASHPNRPHAYIRGY